MSETSSELQVFLRRHPKVGLMDAHHPVTEEQARWVQDSGGRVLLIYDGKPLAAIVSLDDLQFLESSEPSERMS